MTMRIRLAITPQGPRHEACMPWWRVEYSQRGVGETFEYVEAWTRDQVISEVAGPGIYIDRIERVEAGSQGGESMGDSRVSMIGAWGMARGLQGLSGAVTLEGIERELAGRVSVRSVGDAVLPFVSRVAQAIFSRMKADVEGDAEAVAAAEAEYDAVVEDARAAAAEWRAEGLGDFARRLEILLRMRL